MDPKSVTVQDVMTPQPLIAKEFDELIDLVQATRIACIRRVPVVDNVGAVDGIIAVDDVIALVTKLMCDITGSIRSEQRQEWRARAG